MSPVSPSHLVKFYKKHRMSPVHQDIGDRRSHMEKRESLYRHLGIVPGFLEGRSVIEFGPGNGQNALFTYELNPKTYVIVDANPHSLATTMEILDTSVATGCDVSFVESFIEDFTSDDLFDVVFCENVIPNQRNSDELLLKVASFVKPGGIFVATCMDSVPFLSDTLRHLAGSILISRDQPLEENLEILRPFFADHLKVLKGTTRLFDDWVTDLIVKEFPVDSMSMSMKTVIELLGESFCVYGSSPNFFTDWRWFKDLSGPGKTPNAIAIDTYIENIHNFLNCTETFAPRETAKNIELMRLCDKVFRQTQLYDQSKDDKNLSKVVEHVGEIANLVGELSPKTQTALLDFEDALREYLVSGTLRKFKDFESFYGRNNQYISLIRN